MSTARGRDEVSAFQVMPPLTPEQADALRADIAAHGVLVPVVIDQHGRIIDGHNRTRIADELGLTYPVEVRQVADDDEARDLALRLNCTRRHLTREQLRAVIEAEVQRRPDASDRAVARLLGCSPTTVGTVRRVSKLDTPPEESHRSVTIPSTLAGAVAELRRLSDEQSQHEREAALLAACSVGNEPEKWPAEKFAPGSALVLDLLTTWDRLADIGLLPSRADLRPADVDGFRWTPGAADAFALALERVREP